MHSYHPLIRIIHFSGRQDIEFSNSSDTVAAHWHGFIDTESGIKSYHWCVGRTSRVKRLPDETECNIMGWINVGLHVSASRNLSSKIPQGKLINVREK